MDFRILGPLEVGDGHGVLDLGRPKQRAVLAILLISANRVVSRDRLIELMWGDDARENASRALHVYISNLRRTLEPARMARGTSEILVSQAPGYVLRVERDTIDAPRFEALANEGRRLLGQQRPAAARVALVEGLALWRGPALAEFAFEAFALSEAARLEELRAVATEDRVEADLQLGAHTTMVGELELLISEQPLRERLWSLLMLALYRSGRQGEALRAFARARTTLGEQLGIDPSPALRALEADILVQSPTLDWKVPGASGSGAPGSGGGLWASGGAGSGLAPGAASGGGLLSAGGSGTAIDLGEAFWRAAQPTLASVLVGRESELAAVEAEADQLAAGYGRAIALGGEAGIGKTRIARHLALRARKAGWTVLWGACSEAELSLPFLAVHEALAGYLNGPSALSPEQLVASLGPRAAPLATIVPSLGPLVGAGQPGMAADRLRMYDAVLAALRLIAASGPAVLVVDDAHWADGSTVELLDYLSRALASLPLLLVLTYRSDELSRDHPLAALLRSWRRGSIGTVVALKALDRAGVHDLLGSMFGDGEVVESLADLAADRSQGNPFVLEELVREAVERGDVFQTADGVWHRKPRVTLQLPDTVAESILARTDRLEEGALSVLQGAAVLGRTFDLGLLGQVCGCSELDVAVALDAGARHQLVEEDPRNPSRFRFRHALTHEAISGELPLLEGRRLHERAAQALAQQGAPAVDVAVHLLAAGRLAEAVPLCCQAADEAERVGAYAVAADLYERALPGTSSGSDRGRIGAQMGLALMAASQVALASERLAEAVRELDAAGLATEAAAISVELGRALWLAKRPAEAMSALKRGRRDLEDAARDPALDGSSVGSGWAWSAPDGGGGGGVHGGVGPALARAYARLAGAYLAELQIDDGLHAARRGVEVATAVGAHHVRLMGEVYLGWALVEVGQRREGVSVLDATTAELVERRFWDVAVNAVCNNVWMRCFSLRAAEAPPIIAVLDRAEFKPAGAAYARFAEALVAKYLGDHNTCLTQARTLHRLAVDFDMPRMAWWARELEAHALVERGELDAALPLLESLAQVEAQDRREWGSTRLRLLLAQREFQHAAAMAGSWLDEGPWALRDPFASSAVVEALAAGGDRQRVGAVVPGIAAAMAAGDAPHALHQLALGLAQLAMADPTSAASTLGLAADSLSVAGYRVFEARARLALARALAGAGDVVGAGTERATAVALARATSSALVLREAGSGDGPTVGIKRAADRSGRPAPAGQAGRHQARLAHEAFQSVPPR